MSDEEKLPYQAKAQDDTARYREAMVVWRHGGEGAGAFFSSSLFVYLVYIVYIVYSVYLVYNSILKACYNLFRPERGTPQSLNVESPFAVVFTIPCNTITLG